MTAAAGSDKSSKTIALIALVVSIAAAGFSVFQWWNATKESRIAATVEVVKSYRRDLDTEAVIPFFRAAHGIKPVGQDEINAFKFYGFLDFVAILGNRDRLEASYIPHDLVCLIAYAPAAMTTMMNGETGDNSELERFTAAHPCDDKALYDDGFYKSKKSATKK